MSKFRFSKRSYQRLKGVDKKLITLCELVIKRTPIDIGISWMGGGRTSKEQNKIFLDGKSTKDGYVKKSKHQFGKAIDFIPYVNGKPSFEKHNYLIVVGVFYSCASELGMKIRSGLNWDQDAEFITDQKFQDYGHIESMD